MKKTKTIGFRGDETLIDLISVVAASMGKSKNEFITFCIVSTVKAYTPIRHQEYLDGKIQHIEIPGEENA
jgi:hypothetical protein